MTTEVENFEIDIQDQPDTEIIDNPEPAEQSFAHEGNEALDNNIQGPDDDVAKKRERRKLERQKRQERQRQKLMEYPELKNENEFLKQEMARQREQLERLNSLAARFESDTLDKQIKEQENAIAWYNQQLETAISAGDGASAVKLSNEINSINGNLMQLKIQKQQKVPQQHVDTPQQVDYNSKPETQLYMRDFLSKNSWFADPKTEEDMFDFETTKQIDSQVFKDGFRQDTPAYWIELERRMRLAMPDRFDEDQPDPVHKQKSPVGSSTQQPPTPKSGAGKMTFKPYQADVLIQKGYLSEDGKKVLNQEKVKYYYNQWNK